MSIYAYAKAEAVLNTSLFESQKAIDRRIAVSLVRSVGRSMPDQQLSLFVTIATKRSSAD